MTTRTDEVLSLTVNGEAFVLTQGRTVAALLRAMDRDPENTQGLAVAVEGAVIHRQHWADRFLHEGDTVEVITAFQGG